MTPRCVAGCAMMLLLLPERRLGVSGGLTLVPVSRQTP